jgi:hypothetical protein
MNNVVLNFPTFGFVVATRALLGVGIGLLVADRIPPERRRAIGMTLVAIGAATTIPAAIAVTRSRHRSTEFDDSHRPELPAVV